MAEETKNDQAWNQLFEEHRILEEIRRKGTFTISSSAINRVRESRLMAKIDHKANLPKIFINNNLSILPISRSEYIIGPFDTHLNLPTNLSIEVNPAQLPSGIQSIDYSNLYSEAAIISCAFNSGIIEDLLQEKAYFTISGRMSTESWSFDINSTYLGSTFQIAVNNSQCEIDAGFESANQLLIIEAKNYGAEDFLVRQLYYPYRLWKSKVTKKVIPVFLTFSQDVFNFYIYDFEDIGNYNSIGLAGLKRYSIAPEEISTDEVSDLFHNIQIKPEPERIPFPQADRFERVIDLLGLLVARDLTIDDITTVYQFDVRQTGYYTNAARYLGLIDKSKEPNSNDKIYSLNDNARRLMRQRHKIKYLGLIRNILEHEVFNQAFRISLQTGSVPTEEEICKIMDGCNLNISGSTLPRRALTVRSWVNWIWSIMDS